MPKDVVVRLRVTEGERDELKARAESEDLSVSDLIRLQLKKPTRQPRTKTAKADPELLAQVSRVGNNLNQIARQVNSCGLDQESVAFILGDLDTISGQLQELVDAHKTFVSW